MMLAPLPARARRRRGLRPAARSPSPSPRPRSSAPANLRDLALNNAPVLLVAIGMTLVILAGQIDISVGSQFAVCSVCAGLLAKAGLPIAAPARERARARRGARGGQRRCSSAGSGCRRSS